MYYGPDDKSAAPLILFVPAGEKAVERGEYCFLFHANHRSQKACAWKATLRIASATICKTLLIFAIGLR
jgi:hypothetical protein